MAKLYIILEVGFDYNDEVYSTGNYGTTYEAPTNIFKDKKLAEFYCKHLNLKAIKNKNIGEYCYGLGDIDKGGLQEYLEDLGLNVEDYELDLSKLDDDQLEEVYNKTSLNFYEVVEVEDKIPSELIKLEAEERAKATALAAAKKKAAAANRKKSRNFEMPRRKFWKIQVTGKGHTVQFGKIGAIGQIRNKKFNTTQEAWDDSERLIKQKLAKGYKEIK